MHYICLGAFLLACCATSALSLPQSSCVDEQLRLSPLKLLGKCVAPGHVEGESTNLQEPICAERLDRSRYVYKQERKGRKKGKEGKRMNIERWIRG